MKRSLTVLSVISAVILFTASCKKSNDNSAPVYAIPTTYSFANANYAEATTRLGMVDEMSALMKEATLGTLDATKGQKLKNMFANANAPFTTAAFNTSGLQVKNQCATLLQTDVSNDIDQLVTASQSGLTASKGVAGIGTSSVNSATKYALSANGVNYAQVFNKGVMGGLITYQIVTTMNAIASLSIDNTTITKTGNATVGETAMEHAWDLAFGYWDVPVDFPTNKTGAKYWGSYSTQVDAGYHANQILMDAFLKGRAAISNKDTKTITEQATIILQTFERLTGAAVLQEVKEIKEAGADVVAVNSRLSECYGFVNSLKYNPKRKISDVQINEILALFPASYYDLKSTDVDAIRDKVAEIYDFEDVKDVL